MNRLFLKMGGLLAALLLIISWAYAQEDMRAVDNTDFESPQRPSARFDHDTHNETAGLEDCTTCHHLYDANGNKDESESSEDQMCADCHGLKAEGQIPGLRRAFHLNCKGCHMQRKAGPVTCAECHLRE